LGLYYSKWYSWHKLSNFIPFDGNGYYESGTPGARWQSGDVRARYDYNMLDVIGDYCFKRNNHELFAGLGLSYATGKNSVIVGVYQYPGYPDPIIESKTEKANFIGAVIQAGYNYYLLKKRINIGPSGVLRYYGSLPPQYYININIGYNFRLLPYKENK
jgi:hypothetical protein